MPATAVPVMMRVSAGGRAMLEETIDGVLDANGQLQLSHAPHLPPGAVRVTIRPTPPAGRRTLADVLREIAAEKRAAGFPGRSAAEIAAEEAANQAEDEERDRELDAARGANPGAP